MYVSLFNEDIYSGAINKICIFPLKLEDGITVYMYCYKI